MIQEGIGKSPRLAWLAERTSGRSTTSCARWSRRREPVAPSSVYALAPEFELLTGTDPSDEALVAEHVATLERMYFPAEPPPPARPR
jgi:hypothetical protein